jgi:hypothetical protein
VPDQAEARGHVVGDDPRRHAPAVRRHQVDVVGLEDQVADRQDQAVVADQDARALALLAEGRDRACALDRRDLDPDDRGIGSRQRFLVRLDALGHGAQRRGHGRRRFSRCRGNAEDQAGGEADRPAQPGRAEAVRGTARRGPSERRLDHTDSTSWP